MKTKKQILERILGDRGTIFLEYALLEAFIVVGGCWLIMPGGIAYTWLHKELMIRINLIALPLF